MNKLHSKAELICKIHGLDNGNKILDIFSSMVKENTSCYICKFYNNGSCNLSQSQKANYQYHWKDRFGSQWCIAWLDPENRKT